MVSIRSSYSRSLWLIAIVFLAHLAAPCPRLFAEEKSESARSSRSRVKSALDSAEKAYREGNFRNAISQYNSLIREAPEEPTTYLFRGMAYEMIEDKVHAEADYRKALALDPKNYRAMESLAGIIEREGKKIAEALELYEKARELDPRPVWKENLTAWTAILKSRMAKEGSSAVRLWQRGNKHRRKGDLISAFSCYAKAIEINPLLYQAYFSRGLLRIQREDYAAALADFESGLEISPQYPRGYIHRGLVHENMGRFDKALEDFQAATRVEPRDPWAHYYLARMLEQRGDNALALASYEKALGMRTEPNLRRLAEQRVTALRSELKQSKADAARNPAKRKDR